MNAINNTASSYSGTAAGSVDGFDCFQLLNGISSNSSSKCDSSLLAETFSTQFLPNNFTGLNRTGACPLVNPGDSNSTDGHRSFFSFGTSIGSQATDNFTIYDQVITSYLPVFVAMWLKSTSNSSSSTGETFSPGAWADTQIMCISANDTQPGSRNFTEAQSTQNAGGKVTVGTGLVGIVGLAVLLGLIA